MKDRRKCSPLPRKNTFNEIRANYIQKCENIMKGIIFSHGIPSSTCK